MQTNLSQLSISHPTGLTLTPGPEDKLTLHATLTPQKISLDHGSLKYSAAKGHISGTYLMESPDSLVIDVAGEASAVTKDVHLVFREAHWPVPRKLAGVLPFKWGMLHRLTAALIPPYIRPSPVVRWVHSLGKPLVWIFWRLVELLLQVQFRLGTKIAQGKNLVPPRPIEFDCFGESTMVQRPGFTGLISTGRVAAHRTEIERFKGRVRERGL